jgi:GlpG protein
MRQAGQLPAEIDPQPLVDYLLTQGIESKADRTPGGSSLWIFDESQLSEGKEAFNHYLANPHDAQYLNAAREATKVRREKTARAKRAAANQVNVRDRWQKPGAVGRTPVTWLLIGVCAAVALLTNFGNDLEGIRPYLFIARMIDEPGLGWSYLPGLQEIRQGQVWRLFTPMIIHMTVLHFVFNMVWLWILGSRIESRFGSLALAALVLVASAISNLAQYGYSGPELLFVGRIVSGGPNFGGMSGVNYALFGFAWMQTLRVRTGPPLISERDVFVLMVWFVMCFTGWVGPVANVAHAAGLVVGIAIGLIPWRR